ncbi:chemotaxis protein CheA [Reinekea blandensis]|uniref:Chemotaxis protein CheA n=1 Tax=Reinekea blandensis MED297 TaxID=314283 RepID=A4BEI1_9GAMM|nr:chemotaxis protein CheA [Reinekea blandensis]EAR09408.1 CheA Signal Transduction Histidine Kinases (STHK) [Reinekea sp. MED297] [Reinekea blandensis MED297]
MGFEADDEILQDFLVEAGEILEQLSEQLVELENAPEDQDLLNAIFRGFHTVKGGAGFLQLTELVDCCHAAENVFDTLRNGHRVVDSDLMDTVLKALDAVNDMFSSVKHGDALTPADPELIEVLHFYAKPQAETEGQPIPGADVVESAPAEPSASDDTTAEEPVAGGEPGDDITDSEFEQLLDAITEGADEQPPAESGAASADSGSSAGGEDEITEEEFEALLDQLHGKGKMTVGSADSASETQPVSEPPEASSSKSSSDSDEITDDEFEALLDQLHGKGKFSVENGAESTSEPKAPTPPPEPPKAEVPAASPAATKAEPEKVEPEKSAAPRGNSAAAKAPAKPSSSSQDTTVRVDTQRLDDIMNMVGELVLVRNRLVRLGAELENESLQKAVGNLNVVTADLQTSVMKTRMQPIKKVFGRFPRVVRDLARSLKKEVNLELVGEDTDLDKNLVDALADPLVHLVRNSVDHGVEAPDVREANGKPRMGRIVLSAQQEGDHILLTISDDGGGMDPDKLRAIAVKRGVMDQDSADRLSDKECFNLIFAPGFSTKTEISDVSGRGVGMDVVKTKISQLNGTIDIESAMGQGTVINIKVPLTLAIMPTLMVMLQNQAFALPLVSVNEIFHLDLSQTNVVDGREVVIVRGKPIPLYYLKRWLIRGYVGSGDDGQSGHVVVVSVGTQSVGFVVDQLIGQEEVVIKPLGEMLQGTDGMAGATITGDGRIALILDVPSLLKAHAA